MIDEILQSIDLVLTDNKFKINNELFEQKDGLFMGSKLSPILSNIFMAFFFNLIKIKGIYLPKNWFLYVDDLLLIWDKSIKEFDGFYSSINNLYPEYIQFTYELEENNAMPYLDLFLIKKERNIVFEIHRKELSVNRLLNFKSHHMISSKLAVIDSQINRAKFLPKEKLKAE